MLLALVFLIPVFQTASSVMVLLLVVASFFVSKRKGLDVVLHYGWDSFMYLLILLVGMLYTTDKVTGFHVIETSLSLIAFPFIFRPIEGLNMIKRDALFYSLWAGLLSALVYCVGLAVFRYYHTSDIGEFFGEHLTSPLSNTLAVYFAYYLIFAITFGLYLLYVDQFEINKTILILALIFSFLMLLMMGSSTAIISILFSLLYFVLKFVFEGKRTNHNALAFGFSLCFLFSLFALNWSQPEFLGNDEYWERFILWESAVKAMPDWLVGIGTGDYTTVLNDYYRAHHLEKFASDNFNPHNQYLETLFSNGLAGLIALLVMLCRPIYVAIRTQNTLGFLCCFPFIVYGLTEVFLGRYQGVVFFGLLHQVFVVKLDDRK
ncbi:MAG TPA: O-antigen ligase family protein [Cyclobacteriaceae bacterium]|nr:O-antigen ligase family protein [Cyclobacteriaceae bacterium]